MQTVSKLALFATLVACLGTPTAEAADQQIIEVRLYHLTSAEKAKQFDAMMRDGALPVMKAQGLKHVGVFQPKEAEGDKENLRVSVVAYDSMDQLLALRKAYSQDPNFWPSAQDYLQQEKGDPAFTRIESSLLQAFTGMPQLAVPGSGEGKQRVFELRIYESFSEIKGLLKLQMFNEGEVDLFKKVNLNAVFYGEAIVAANLPQLTYMLVYDDEASQKKAWKDFLSHPEWDRLKNIEQYKDTVSKIKNHFLVPMDYSTIK